MFFLHLHFLSTISQRWFHGILIYRLIFGLFLGTDQISLIFEDCFLSQIDFNWNFYAHLVFSIESSSLFISDKFLIWRIQWWLEFNDFIFFFHAFQSWHHLLSQYFRTYSSLIWFHACFTHIHAFFWMITEWFNFFCVYSMCIHQFFRVLSYFHEHDVLSPVFVQYNFHAVVHIISERFNS